MGSCTNYAVSHVGTGERTQQRPSEHLGIGDSVRTKSPCMQDAETRRTAGDVPREFEKGAAGVAG